MPLTPDGRILTANANFLNAVGYGLNEIVGQHHSLFCDPGYVQSDEYRRFWSDLAAGKFQSNEFKRFAKGGKAVWLQATYNPIKDGAGKVVKVVKFAADITTAKLQAIDYAGKIAAIDLAQAVIEFTPTGVVVTANDNFLNALGYRLDEIKGSVAGAIEEQHAVTGEISNNMQAAVGAVRDIEENLGHINTTFSNVANASEQVKQSVEELVA